MSNRLNDSENGVIVIIMQRVHADDVSGAILDLQLDYCHLMIPMEYDAGRALDEDGNLITTEIGWVDPRCVQTAPFTNDGMLAWTKRFPPHVVERIKKEVGPYSWAGQYGQSPAPRGGGIFKTEWWQVWDSPDGKFPIFDLVIASVDSAFTANQLNDPTGMTVWGVWHKDGKRRLMLINAWRKHLAFSGVRTPYEPGESKAQWQRRTQPTWGLLEWIQYTCERFKVDKLLIEAKASGISAAQELQNRYGRQDWSTQLCPVKGDKVARATAVQATFSNLGVYAPIRDWSEMVIEEMAVFPTHKYDDLTDSSTQAVKYLRDSGMAPTDEEVLYEQQEAVTLKPKQKVLYPI
jgi:predicted phage terminase large subunit-like protein